MTPQEMTDFLHREIPLTAAMEISVQKCSRENIILTVPLLPNKNDKNTGFGGSISCLLTVCGWVMMYCNFHEKLPHGKIVIQSSQMRYLAPITSDFRAECICQDEEGKEALLESYAQRKKGKLSLSVSCYCGERKAAEMEATYYITD